MGKSLSLIKKLKFFLILLLFLTACKGKTSYQVLEYTKGIKFSQIKFDKVFEISHYNLFNCIPLSDRIVCVLPLGARWSQFIISNYDYSGNLILEKRVKWGQGPYEIGGFSFSRVISANDDEIIWFDSYDYLKSMETKTFKIKAIGKLSNLIKGYGSKYVPSKIFTSIEKNDNTCLTTFSSPGFYDNFKYYFVKFDGAFENFKIIASEKTEAIKIALKRNKKAGKRVVLMDYYSILREKTTFSVDWKRNFLYYISLIDEPVIDRVNFEGKNRKRFKIDIDYKNFEIDKRKINLYCEYINSFPKDPLLLNLKYKCYYPPHAPPLHELKVTDDFLIIITGKRNWEREENEALVYKLPEMEFKGSLDIPFPNFAHPYWFNNYYITPNLVKKDEDYSFSLRIYKVKKES